MPLNALCLETYWKFEDALIFTHVYFARLENKLICVCAFKVISQTNILRTYYQLCVGGILLRIFKNTHTHTLQYKSR